MKITAPAPAKTPGSDRLRQPWVILWGGSLFLSRGLCGIAEGTTGISQYHFVTSNLKYATYGQWWTQEFPTVPKSSPRLRLGMWGGGVRRSWWASSSAPPAYGLWSLLLSAWFCHIRWVWKYFTFILQWNLFSYSAQKRVIEMAKPHLFPTKAAARFSKRKKNRILVIYCVSGSTARPF